MNPFRTPRDIQRTIVEACDRTPRFAVVTVLDVAGSTPVKAGAKAIIDANGAIFGTVGGGMAEAEAQRRAPQAIQVGRPIVFTFDLEGSDVDSRDPICGGTMLFLVDPTAASHRATYAEAAAARQARKPGILLTTIQGQQDPRVDVRFVPHDALSSEAGFPDAEALRPVLERGQSQRFSQDSPAGHPWIVLAEPVVPNPLLVIFGGGHVGQALALQGNLVGFDVAVVDDRPEFTAPELYPEGVVTRCGPIDTQLDQLPITEDTFLVIVTRGHRHDAEVLAACLKKPSAYLGMIGSRRKVALMRKEFLQSGRATEAELNRVYAPIGLDIGAQTVPEIAASITAQLIAVRRRGTAPRILST